MAAADLEAGLRSYLLTQANVTAIAPGGIYSGELNEDETAQQARGAIVIKSSGGVSTNSASTVEVDTRRVDIFAFGSTPRLAGQLMAETALALKRLRRSVHAGTLLYWANSAGGQASGREPTTEWPRAFQSFQVKFALEAVE